MDEELRRFSPKGKLVYIKAAFVNMPWAAIILAAVLFGRPHRSETINLIIYSAFAVFTALSIYTIYEAAKSAKGRTADIILKADRIVIPYRYYGSIRTINMEDIKDISVPRWDKHIDIILNDDEKVIIPLNIYEVKDQQEIKEIFTNIIRREQEDVNSEEIKRTSHVIVNGKTYIK